MTPWFTDLDIKFKILQETHRETRYPNVTYVAMPLLRLAPPTEEFRWDDLRKIFARMSKDG